MNRIAPLFCQSLVLSSSVVPDFMMRRIGGGGWCMRTMIFSRPARTSSPYSPTSGKKALSTYLAKIPPNRNRGGESLFGLDRLFFNRKGLQEKLDLYTRMVNARISEIYAPHPHIVQKGPDFHQKARCLCISGKSYKNMRMGHARKRPRLFEAGMQHV